MKNFIKIMALIVGMTCLFGLTACKERGDKGGDGTNTYTYEAEHVSLDGLISDTYSGSIGDVNLVYGDGTQEEKDRGWSNGYYVGPTYDAGFTLNFVFKSDAAETASITAALGSDIGNIALNASNFNVKLNGTDVNFGTLSIKGSESMDAMSFKDFQLASNLNLVQGENTLSLIVLGNTLWGGKQGGPMIDCVKIKTKANITWEIIDNPSNR